MFSNTVHKNIKNENQTKTYKHITRILLECVRLRGNVEKNILNCFNIFIYIYFNFSK